MNEVNQAETHQGEDRINSTHIQEQTDGDMIARWASSAEAIATNIDVKTEEGRILAGKCGGTADLKTRSVVKQVIVVTGFYAHIAELTNRLTGEVSRKIRVVLILDDGRTVSTMSGPCTNSLSKMIRMREKGFAKWPIHIETQEYPLEGGKSYCDMREVLPVATRNGKKS
jgi:hypothetical protein